ncbi:MAG: GGDEF domain-containing protein [Candidatus Omnitrophica bacterium]|nr:GGDEF domain-containing protein [Candidatus Omnitrophota bacterium]
MLLTIITYVALVIYCAWKVFISLELKEQEKIFQESARSQRLVEQRESLHLEKMLFENEALEILTLYEIMKEISQSLSEKEAFEIFQKKLSAHVVFQECLLVHPLSDEINDYKKSPEYFLFPLQGRGGRIGFLVVRGLAQEDRDKFIILGHQFALALRRIKLYQEIERIAITDSLTELHTRRYTTERFQEELSRAKARGMKLSFMMIDVDYFKNFNDQHGHLAGDQILCEVARLIRENIREIDIAGRFGGEEFCVVLPDTDRTGARYAAERIRQAVDRAVIKAYDTEVKITVSLGVATYPEDGAALEEFVDKADWALYRAKREGRNRVCSFGIYD